jgi:hypothetical protein
MHVTSGFCPGKGAKHNLGQGQRGQAEVGELPTEAGVGGGEAGELPRSSEDLRDSVRRGASGRRRSSLLIGTLGKRAYIHSNSLILFDILSLNLHMFTFNKTFVPNLSYTH